MAKVRKLTDKKREKSKFRKAYEASEFDNPFDFLFSCISAQKSQSSPKSPKK